MKLRIVSPGGMAEAARDWLREWFSTHNRVARGVTCEGCRTTWECEDFRAESCPCVQRFRRLALSVPKPANCKKYGTREGTTT